VSFEFNEPLMWSTPIAVLRPYCKAEELRALRKAGIDELGQLLNCLPKRYEDRRQDAKKPLILQASLTPQTLYVSIEGLQSKGFGRTRWLEATLRVKSYGDQQAPWQVIKARWFQAPYLYKMLAVGQQLMVFGKIKEQKNELLIDHPEFEILRTEGEAASWNLNRIVGIYPSVSGLAVQKMRRILGELLRAELWDLGSVPSFPMDGLELSRFEILQVLHFPESIKQAYEHKRELAKEEFYNLQLAVLKRKQQRSSSLGYRQGEKTELLTRFYHNLPFDLTDCQKKAIKEVAADMRSEHPMNRLLQGDVGSGKTMVAACSILLALDSGNQAAFMAPTQILAEQHYYNLKSWFEPLGIKLGLMTSETSKREVENDVQVWIGTHALLFKSEIFERLRLVIIDEQHKFGVEQTEKLAQKGHYPDVLVMTATPIPRTITLTFYGDLDVSIIRQLPKGRGKIVTKVRYKPKVREMTQFLKDQIEEGRQIYLVYPRVEENEESKANMKGASAMEQHEVWQKRLSKHQVGLLHGRLKPQEKQQVMQGFKDGDTQVLVSTTVIEVGMDVPNASVMIIFGAENFGLAQLHQLRGRVGRGQYKSYCVLVMHKQSPEALEKLQILENSGDGFVIAEQDLKMRGPGAVMGTAQSGFSNVRFASYFYDVDLLEEVKVMAEEKLKELS